MQYIIKILHVFSDISAANLKVVEDAPSHFLLKPYSNLSDTLESDNQSLVLNATFIALHTSHNIV